MVDGTVRNYLVTAVRPISQGWHLESNQDLYHAYGRMYHMMLASWQRFSHCDFIPVLLTAEVENNRDYCVQNWRAIRDLWHQESCNIVWAGADTLMIQPTVLFGGFNQYRLFNYTEPRQHESLPQYFNDDIQYFPHSMSQQTWDLGEELLANFYSHPEGNWGYDQIRHNLMFWDQDIDEQDRCHPKLAWQAMRLRSLDQEAIGWHESWNNCRLGDAHILHFHASRGSEAVINIMQQICDKLGIQHATHT